MNSAETINDRMMPLIRELLDNGITLEQAADAFERKYIVAAMSASGGNVTQASKKLGVHRNTLHNKLRLRKPEDQLERDRARRQRMLRRWRKR